MGSGVEMGDEGDLSTLLIALAGCPSAFAPLDRYLDRYLHRVRNRLNTIRLGLYLARRAEENKGFSLGGVDAAYRELEQFVDQFQRLTRPIELRPVRGSLGQFLNERIVAWRRCTRGPGERLDYEASGADQPRPIDPDRLGQALEAVLERRMRSLNEGERIRLSLEGPRLSLQVMGEARGPVQGESNSVRRATLTASDLSTVWLARVAEAHGATFRTAAAGPDGWTIHWN